MKPLASFKGGIHPPGKKKLVKSSEISTAALPATAIVPLVQHIGAPAKWVVKVGDTVKEEQLLAEAQGFVSANIHSPIPGTVVEIKNVYLGHGPQAEAAVIELSGEFTRLGKERETHDWRKDSPESLLSLIHNAGIVGLGGATFPSHVKFTLPEGKDCEYFIINAVECESYLKSDHHLMMHHAKEILEGIEIIQTILAPKNTVIGIEANKMDAAKHLDQLIQEAGLDMEVQPLRVKYPQGAEKNLIKAVTGREIPSGKLPLEVGVINANVSTCYAVYEAVVQGKPLVERLVTLSGGALRNPGVYKARIGTPISELIEEAGGIVERPVRVVSGGPMMGTSFFDMDTPIIKSTSGILLLTEEEVKDSVTTACLSCGKCLGACPMGLNPTTMYKQLDFEEVDHAVDIGLMDCVECGSCSYVCPAHIPLVSMFKIGRTTVRRRPK